MYYWFVHVCQANTNLVRTGIFFQNKLHISKLLTIIFISMFDMQYWNSIDVCNTWKIKEKLKILVWFNIVDLLHFSSKFPDPPKIRNMKIPLQYENFLTLPSISFSKILNPLSFCREERCMPWKVGYFPIYVLRLVLEHSIQLTTIYPNYFHCLTAIESC